jgi:organic radical activating enzyme
MPQCRALDNQVHVTIDGYYKPCCAFNEHSTAFPITQYTAEEFLQSDYMNSIRSSMETAWHPGCVACELNEQSKSQSVRQMYNFLCRKADGVELLDLNLNNDCNLSCRMCSSLNSSKWAELLNEPLKNKNSFKAIIKNLKNIKHIKYQGGEPFITKEITEVLEHIAKHNCEFSFSTNCTVFPQKYLDLLSQAKFLYATFSIDGIGTINDYIRHGKDWNIIETVFEKWMTWLELNNVKSFKNINTVVQAYNFHDLENIKLFADRHKVKWNGLMISDIPEFTINALPETYIKSVVNSTNEKFLNNYHFDETLYRKLKNKTLQQDKLLQKNIEDYNPQLHKVLCEIE